MLATFRPQQNIFLTLRAGPSACLLGSLALSISLPSLGSHGPTDRLAQLSMLAYSHGSAWGWVAFHGKALFLVPKHLFISLQSVPSTRPVKTTPTQPHNWSESVKEPIKRSAAARNTQHIHTVRSPMGHRGASKITELGPYHLALSLAANELLSLHTSFSEMCVCVKERGGLNVCVRVRVQVRSK